MKYEKSEGGILTPRLALRGTIGYDVYRDGELIGSDRNHNVVVNDGLTYVLNAAFIGTGATTTFYLGVLNNATPLTSWALSNAATNEFTAYSQGTRQPWTEALSTYTVTNTASKASITINDDSQSIYGLFLCTANSTKGDSATGTLIAAGLFSSARTGLMTDDVVQLTYEITAADA